MARNLCYLLRSACLVVNSLLTRFEMQLGQCQDLAGHKAEAPGAASLVTPLSSSHALPPTNLSCLHRNLLPPLLQQPARSKREGPFKV